jgi:glycosyltransferase involved in cell wall biosynthesis
MKLSIVIPVYKSGKSLETNIKTIVTFFSKSFESFEIICIDDGSPDDSWQTIQALGLIYPNLKGYRLSKNFGQWAATLCGLQHSSGDILLTMDDDGKHSPQDGLQLITYLERGQYDVVSGIYAKSLFFNWLPVNVNILDQLLRSLLQKRHNSSFMALKKQVVLSNTQSHHLKMGLDAHLKWTLSPDRVGQLPLSSDSALNSSSRYQDFGRLIHLQKNLPNYLGWREVLVFSSLIWSGALLFTSLYTATGLVALFLLFIVVGYLTEILLYQRGRPYYWVIENWPPN